MRSVISSPCGEESVKEAESIIHLVPENGHHTFEPVIPPEIKAAVSRIKGLASHLVPIQESPVGPPQELVQLPQVGLHFPLHHNEL